MTQETFIIVDNYELPATASTRVRTKEPFALAIDALEVKQGFEFTSEIPMKLQYARVAPKKFGGKRFKVVVLGENKFAVKRMS